MDSEDAKLGGSGTAVGPGIMGAGEFGGCQASEASGQGCQVQEADTVDMDELSDLQAAMDSFSKVWDPGSFEGMTVTAGVM
jgi:S-adenosylhomocysteine hydrolase